MENQEMLPDGPGPMHQKRPSRYYRRWQRLSDFWVPEISALCTAILALLCIFTTLALYNGKPLSSWSHIISLNTALSTLGTIMKGFMLVAVASSIGQLKWIWYAEKKRPLRDFQAFDIASRGPWGSAQLLVQTSLFGLASIGALATVLAMASDSFIQQSVALSQNNVEQPDLVASVPYAQEYIVYVPDPDSWGTVSWPMMAALMDGIFAPNLTESSSSLQDVCPTGNCTSPQYASLAVCTKCMDVTDVLNQTTVPNSFGNITSYTLPNGHFLLGTAESSLGYLNITASSVNLDALSSMELNTGDLNEYISQGTIANFSIIYQIPEAADISNDTADPTAYDCTFFFCAQSYLSSSNKHVFQENITETHEDPTWNEIASKSAGDPSVLYSFEAPVSFADNRTFAVNSSALIALTHAFGSFHGAVGQDVGGRTYYDTPIAQGFYYHELANQSVPDTAHNIATAMTYAVRQASGTQVTGQTWTSEPFIQVQWAWLALPLVILLLAAILLALAILQTKRAGLPNWRCSELATMAYGVHATRTECPSDTTDAMERSFSELDGWGRGLNVRLQRSRSVGWGFRLRPESQHAVPSVYGASENALHERTSHGVKEKVVLSGQPF